MRLPRLGADNRDAAREGFQQRTSFGDCGLRAGHHHPQPALFGNVGAAKDRRGDEFMPAAGMLLRQPLAQRDADGAA